jgi:transposase
MSENSRRHFSPEEKVAILRRHLLEKIPVSQLCDQHGIAPSVFYHWQREFFENGHRAFGSNGRQAKKAESVKEERIERLEAKIRRKDEVMAELLEAHVQLKKELGEP